MNRTQLQSALRSLVVPYSGLTSEKMALILQRRLAWAEMVKGLSLESMTVAQLRDLYRQSGYQKYWRAKTKDELVRGIRWLAGKSVSLDTRPRPKQSRGDEWVSLVFTHPRTGRRVALVTEQMSPAEAARAKPQYFIDRHRRAFGTWRFAQWYPWYDPDFQVSYDGAPMSDEELSDLEALIRDDPHDPAIRRVFEDDPHDPAIRRVFEARRNPSFTVADAQRALDALGVRPRGYTAADLARGMNVELEHRDITKGDPVMTARIALAHLRESPRYYDALEKMERTMPRENPSIRPVNEADMPKLGMRKQRGGVYLSRPTKLKDGSTSWSIENDEVYRDGYVDVSGERADFTVSDTKAKMPDRYRRRIGKVNLFRQAGKWKWVGKGVPTSTLNFNGKPTHVLVSVEVSSKHFYALCVEFYTPVALKTYPKQPSEPRLRPTSYVERIEMANVVGTIEVRGKRHPVYDRIVLR